MITQKQIEAQRLLFSKPILIGEKIAVKLLTVRNRHFSILDGVSVPNRIMVDIDPKFVFGNGIHATTQMVTESIEKHINEGARVLDIGCGTGIQSIISVLLGAEKVESVDIAPEAVKTTEHNAKLNNVSDKITARVGSLTEGASGKYDLIVANILADPVIELLGDLSRLCKKKTTVVLSGIKDSREDDVLEAAKDFEIIERHSRDGWVCLVMKLK